MTKPELTCLYFPDLLPWERAGVQPLVDCLSRIYEVRCFDVQPGEKPAVRDLRPGGQVWVLAYRWEEAVAKLRVPRGTKIFVSVLSASRSTSLLPALLWQRLRPLSSAVHLVTHSPLSFRFLGEIGGIPKTQLSYLPMPMIPEAIVQDSSPPEQEITVGTVARFTSESNLHYFLNVAHYVAQKRAGVRFKILGAGPLRGHLGEIVRDLDLSSTVSFAEGDASALDALDLLLYLPLQNTHFLPVLLAASNQIPVIASELPGIEAYLRDGHNGFIVPVNETKPMAELVLRMAQDRFFRHSMGERLGAALAQEFSPSKLIESYRAELLGTNRSSAEYSKAA